MLWSPKGGPINEGKILQDLLKASLRLLQAFQVPKLWGLIHGSPARFPNLEMGRASASDASRPGISIHPQPRPRRVPAWRCSSVTSQSHLSCRTPHDFEWFWFGGIEPCVSLAFIEPALFRFGSHRTNLKKCDPVVLGLESGSARGSFSSREPRVSQPICNKAR